MPGEVLAFWIKTLSLVESTGSSVYTGIPRVPHNLCVKFYGRKSEGSSRIHSKTFSTRWIQGPIGGIVRPAERGWPSSKVILRTEKKVTRRGVFRRRGNLDDKISCCRENCATKSMELLTAKGERYITIILKIGRDPEATENMIRLTEPSHLQEVCVPRPQPDSVVHYVAGVQT
jgi:hypothetical protein